MPSISEFAGSQLRSRLPLLWYFELAEQRGLILSEMRQLVLNALWRAQVPLGAYEIAAAISRPRRPRAHPNSIYRALAPLEGEGLVVRVVATRRFLLTPDAGVKDWIALACKGCGNVTLLEAGSLHERMREHARARRFRVARTTVEILGRCAVCIEADRS